MDFVTQSIINQANKVNKSMRDAALSGSKPKIPSMDSPPVSDNVSRETDPNSLQLIPEGSKEFLYLESNSKDFEVTEENKNVFKDQLNASFNSFTPEQQERIKQKQQQEITPDMTMTDRVKVAKNIMLLESYFNLPLDVKQNIVDYSKANGFDKDQSRELIAQAVALNGKNNIQVLTEYLKNDGPEKGIALKDFQTVYLDIKPDKPKEENDMALSKNLRDLEDNLVKNKEFAKTNKTFNALIENNEAIKNIVGVTPDEMAALMDDKTAKPEGFQIDKLAEYANPIELGKDVFKSALSGGGSAVWAAYGLIQRDAQYGTALAIKLKSMYEKHVNGNTDAAEAYGMLAGQIYDAAAKDTTLGFFSLKPPTKSFDSFDMFDVLVGRYAEPRQESYLDKITTSPIKTVANIMNVYEANKLLEEQFKMKNKISSFELYSRYAHNTMVTTWGFLGDAVLSPLSLVLAPLKVAGSAAKTSKLSLKAVASVDVFKETILESTKLIEQGVKKKMMGIAKGMSFEDIQRGLKYAGEYSKDVSKMTEAEFLKHKALLDAVGLNNEDIISIRDLGVHFNRLGEIKDQILEANMKLTASRKLNSPMMIEEQQSLVSKVVNLSQQYKELAIDIADSSGAKLPKRFASEMIIYKESKNKAPVYMMDGLARLSKSGEELMKKFKGNLSATDAIGNFNAELKFAKEAIKNPKLLDEGITYFGMEIPGTRRAIVGAKELRANLGLFSKFPTGSLGSEMVLSKHILQVEGQTQATDLFVNQLAKDISSIDKKRISFAVEMDAIDKLPDNLKLIALQAKDSFDSSYMRALELSKETLDLWKKRGVSDDVIGGFDDILIHGKVQPDRIARWSKSGMSTEQIAKLENDLARINVAGNYIEDYQTMIYKNKKNLDKAFKYADEMKLTGTRSADPYYNRMDVGKLDQFAKSRKFKNRAQAISLYTDEITKWYNDKKLPSKIKEYNLKYKATKDTLGKEAADQLLKPQPMSQRGVSGYVDSLIDDLVVSGKQDVADDLEAISKLGLDSELDFDKIMTARLHSSNKVLQRRRLNLDLSKNFGINDTMNNYFKDGAFITAESTEFHGVKIPEGINRALLDLDTPSFKERLRKEIDTRSEWSNSFRNVDNKIKLSPASVAVKLGILKTFDAADAVNGWFSTMVTTIHAQFHTRNAYSNTIMNFFDKGIEAFNPVTAKKTLSLISNKTVKGFGKDIIFQNKFNQLVTGEEMLDMMRKAGALTPISHKVQVPGGADTYRNFFEYNPFNKVSQGVEDFHRAQNFILSWQEGFSFEDAAFNSQRALVNYGNTTRFQREVINRTLPWMTFYKENFKNSFRWAIKNPERVFAATKVSAHLAGGKIVDRSDISPGTVDYNRAPIFTDEYLDPATKKMVSTQTTRTSNPIEDMFRFTSFFQKQYEGLIYLSAGNFELAKSKGNDAAREGMDFLFPAYKLPVYLANELMDGNLFYEEKLNPIVAEYLAKTPSGFRKMLGFDFDIDITSGEVFVEMTPLANILLELSGTGRSLYKLGVIGDEGSTAMEAMNSIFGVYAKKKWDLEEAKANELMSSSKKLKKANDIVMKSIENIFKQEELQKMYLEQNKKK